MLETDQNILKIKRISTNIAAGIALLQWLFAFGYCFASGGPPELPIFRIEMNSTDLQTLFQNPYSDKYYPAVLLYDTVQYNCEARFRGATARNLPKKSWKVKEKMGLQKPDVWFRLDVNILAHYVFAKLWGLGESRWEQYLRFTHSAQDAVKRVRNQEACAAFLLRAPRVRSLKEMGEAGELMPQKSTYFYPKLASGLVFFRHE